MLNIAHRCFITLIVIVYINSKHYNWKDILKKIKSYGTDYLT